MNVDNYNFIAKKRNWSQLILTESGVVAGFWWFGHWYNTSRTSDKKYFYGAYPCGYLDRVFALFPNELTNGKVLHLFSGTLKGDGIRIYTFDINPELNPTHCGNAEELSNFFKKDFFDIILADPPYNDNYKKYNTKPFSRKKVIQECSIVLRDKGFLVWLDTVIPQWKKADGWKYRGNIGVAMSTNHAIRGITILQVSKK